VERRVVSLNEVYGRTGNCVARPDCIDPSAHEGRGPQDDSVADDGVGGASLKARRRQKFPIAFGYEEAAGRQGIVACGGWAGRWEWGIPHGPNLGSDCSAYGPRIEHSMPPRRALES
jgi:hypothetical protein